MKSPLQTLILTIILVAPAVFAQGAVDKLIFSHKQHVVTAGAECVDCHAATAANPGKGAADEMTEEICKKCHEDAITEKNCAMCHTNAANVKPPKTLLVHKNFSHQEHLKQKDVKCALCHKDIEKIEHATAKNLPGMEVCLTCHNDKIAPRNCRACHPDGLKKPASHNVPGFEGRVHGRDARFAKLLCEQCHEQSSCDACHRGQDKRKIHRADIRFTHGFEAKKGDKNCNFCHEPEHFCAKCHEGRK